MDLICTGKRGFANRRGTDAYAGDRQKRGARKSDRSDKIYRTYGTNETHMLCHSARRYAFQITSVLYVLYVLFVLFACSAVGRPHARQRFFPLQPAQAVIHLRSGACGKNEPIPFKYG